MCLSHVEELAMKINHHAGGKNYNIDNVGLPPKKSIVLGISISHSTCRPGGVFNNCPYVAAVVANSEKDFLNFPGSMRFQPYAGDVSYNIPNNQVHTLTRFIESERFEIHGGRVSFLLASFCRET
jgi:hypothetical protein